MKALSTAAMQNHVWLELDVPQGVLYLKGNSGRVETFSTLKSELSVTVCTVGHLPPRVVNTMSIGNMIVSV